MMFHRLLSSSSFVLFVLFVVVSSSSSSSSAAPLPNTKPLDDEGDLAARMVAGIDKYLDRELKASVEQRKQFWKPDFSSPEAYSKSVQPNRERLKKIIGVVDQRLPPGLEYVGGPDQPALVAETKAYKIYAVRWRVLPGVDGEGLLLEPTAKPIANVVALPDADQTPEMLVGLAPALPKESQFARRLAENDCRVLVPVLIDRRDDFSGNPKLGRMTNQPHREFIYRMAYEMGRHIIGYEVQKVLAAVDWFTREKGHAPVGVIGYGEGGLIAVMAAALDERIKSVMVSGYFGRTGELWEEPIYRNVWSYLREFGDDGVARLIQPRRLVIETNVGPEIAGPPKPRNGRGGAAPGMLTPTSFVETQQEADRVLPPDAPSRPKLTFFKGKVASPCSQRAVSSLIESLTDTPNAGRLSTDVIPTDSRKNFDPRARQKRQFDQLVAFTQKVWRDSEPVRAARFAKCDRSSPEAWDKSVEPMRDFFWEEVIGKLPPPDRPMNPRSRQIYDEPKWTGHEVTLDLYPDVFAYGILLLPKDLKPGEKRPVVVCQHGLEGRPTDVTNPRERTKYYNSFAAQLADRGYIVFAPQNPYIGHDKFRVLQRKANPLKLSLFSFIVRQHERILDWLGTHPNVDPDRIAFYGLSYGGKTAVRVPALLKRYCLSICSGDFNEWVGKNVSYDLRMSYMFSPEYEMPEFDLGQTFNYAEMAYLIAPRPFMVERGHDDGVGIDEMIASEYAKVRYLYANKLKIPERTAIEFFAGGHEINGKGTFAFLQKHLNWPLAK